MRNSRIIMMMCALGCGVTFHMTAQETMHRTIMSLNDGWQFYANGGDTSYPASVPGSIHNDLWLNELISDPFQGIQFDSLGWIDTTTWVYEKKFAIRETIRSAVHVELIFKGLDTYADVYIDGVLAITADNMHRTWRFPLSSEHLKCDSLSLKIIFHSAIIRGREKSYAYDWIYPADSDPYTGKPSVFTRKAHYQFGWDFSPSMPGAGIWKDVWLEVLPCIYFADTHWETVEISSQGALLHLNISIFSDIESQAKLSYQLGTSHDQSSLSLTTGFNTFVIPIYISQPRLWWPDDHYGDPFLYDGQVKLISSCGIDTVHAKVGIRTIELDQSTDQWGTAFQFIVNGTPIFCKGANWVPADVFPGRVTDGKYRKLLGLAAEAGMNMLRVWGGGIYEKDLFYHLADSLGIMIWQDFMFAGTMYPGDVEFMDNIEKEATDQLYRLRKHPSVVLWCGNNEVDVAWKNWGWQNTYQYNDSISQYLSQTYQTIFHALLPATVKKIMPNTPYVHTSPLSNWGKKSDLNHGNNHYWGVWHGDHSIDSFSTWIARFMTEYGLPSYSSLETLSEYIPLEMRVPTHRAFAGRQRSYKGNQHLIRYIQSRELPFDTQTFNGFVNAGHRIQAIALRKAVQAHLNDFPRCSGTLLWQFNEPWPGVSWSIVDYKGRPKEAWYAVALLFVGEGIVPEGDED